MVQYVAGEDKSPRPILYEKAHFSVRNPMPKAGACEIFTSPPDQTQPPVARLTGLRYQEVFKFLPAGASQPAALEPMG